jgi:hypothetical protein
MVAAQQRTHRVKNVRVGGIRSEEDENVAGQSAGGDRMNVFALPECLFKVLSEMVTPPEPVDLITTSPSNGLVNDLYHGIILHADSL